MNSESMNWNMMGLPSQFALLRYRVGNYYHIQSLQLIFIHWSFTPSRYYYKSSRSSPMCRGKSLVYFILNISSFQLAPHRSSVWGSRSISLAFRASCIMHSYSNSVDTIWTFYWPRSFTVVKTNKLIKFSIHLSLIINSNCGVDLTLGAAKTLLWQPWVSFKPSY